MSTAVQTHEHQREREALGALVTGLIARAVEHGCNYSITHTDADRGTGLVEVRFWPFGQSLYYAPVSIVHESLPHAIDKALDAIDHFDWAAEAQR